MRLRSLALVPAAGFAFAACSSATFDVALGLPDGELVASTVDAIDNECQPVSGSGTNWTLANPPSPAWEPGRRVFLLQVADAFADVEAANDTGDAGAAGFWDLVPISRVTGTALVTAAAAQHEYRSTNGAAAQACLVREYSTLSLASSVAPVPWNGASGGVLIFFADALEVGEDNWVDATATGFLGGIQSGDESSLVATTTWDATPSTGGGKGRGIDSRSGDLFGRGTYRNAGGGGNRRRGGGGGGAGAGSGGAGADGITALSGGLGGHVPDPGTGIERLFFGGGGGGGHRGAIAAIAGSGGAGGGLVFVAVREMSFEGAGGFRSNGGAGGNAITGVGGGGGGGGGAGTVVVWVESDADAAWRCDARGRSGGFALGAGGIGAGGGGGACWANLPSVVNVSGGAAAFDSGVGGAGVSGDPGVPSPLD